MCKKNDFLFHRCFSIKKRLLESLAKVQGNKCISMRDFELWQSMIILWQHNNIFFSMYKKKENESEIDEFFVCLFRCLTR